MDAASSVYANVVSHEAVQRNVDLVTSRLTNMAAVLDADVNHAHM